MRKRASWSGALVLVAVSFGVASVVATSPADGKGKKAAKPAGSASASTPAPIGTPAPPAETKSGWTLSSRAGDEACGEYYKLPEKNWVRCTSAQTCCLEQDNHTLPNGSGYAPLRHCADLNTDDLNCGGCGRKCPEGLTCNGGLCAHKPTEIECKGKWVDKMEHPDNCGKCGNVCPHTCEKGKCVGCKKKGETACKDSVDGERVCADLRDDVWHCGRCFHRCPDGWDCRAGRCVP